MKMPRSLWNRMLLPRLARVAGLLGFVMLVFWLERENLRDALLVTPIRIFVWFVLLGTAYEFVFQRLVEHAAQEGYVGLRGDATRRLNESARIIATVRNEENLKLVRKAGADEVVSPAKIAGLLIAERTALLQEAGKRMREVADRLAVAIERDGSIHGFRNAPQERIRNRNLVFATEGRNPGSRSGGGAKPA